MTNESDSKLDAGFARLEDLVPGVQILDPRFGIGTIRHVVNGQLRVAFGETVRTIQPSARLRIVTE